jgi:hypothetical protein
MAAPAEFEATYLPFNNLMVMYLPSIQFYECIAVFIASLDFPPYTLCLKQFFQGTYFLIARYKETQSP